MIIRNSRIVFEGMALDPNGVVKTGVDAIGKKSSRVLHFRSRIVKMAEDRKPIGICLEGIYQFLGRDMERAAAILWSAGKIIKAGGHIKPSTDDRPIVYRILDGEYRFGTVV